MKNLHLSSKDLKILRSIFNGNFDTIIFGSRVSGTNQQFSDIDICLKGEKLLDKALISDLRALCSESDLPYTVDLVDYHDLSPDFREIVDQTGIHLAR